MICTECEWRGDIHELAPQHGDEYGNERCPECDSMDVMDEEEYKKKCYLLHDAEREAAAYDEQNLQLSNEQPPSYL